MVDDSVIEAARDEVRTQLRTWRDLNADRDRLVRRARRLGVPYRALADDTGLHRSHLSQIVNKETGT